MLQKGLEAANFAYANKTEQLITSQKLGSRIFIESLRVSHRCQEHGGGALQNLMGDLKSVHKESMGGLKCCRKIPVKEFI